MTKRDFLALEQLGSAELDGLLELAARVKRGELIGGLERKVLAMVFMDPSLRTRTSFETAMYLHGGHGVVLEPGKGSWSLETEPGSELPLTLGPGKSTSLRLNLAGSETYEASLAETLCGGELTFRGALSSNGKPSSLESDGFSAICP